MFLSLAVTSSARLLSMLRYPGACKSSGGCNARVGGTLHHHVEGLSSMEI